MPISNQQDARDLGEHVRRVFATSQSERQTAIRALFVEKLDFNPASGQVDLTGAAASARLPGVAERIAQLDGVYVLYVALNIPETNRVRKTEAAAAARLIAAQLGEDMLLVFTNTACSQLHFIHPDFDGAQPTLRRMVVERDLPRRTAVEQFSKVYWSYERSGSIRDALAEAFDVEPVTRQFFQEYKRVFEAAKAQVSGFGRSEEDKRLFVQTLFNRLMFVYFLSRKGWLTFSGDKDYLNALWNDYRAAPLHSNFYTSRLCPLFFAGLNNPQSRNLNRDNPKLHDRIGDVPFLNGGLFEKTDLDSRDGVTVPDTAIEPVLRDLFDKFNFTVMESTPFDIEVAVAPEMLGKVFEELVTGRHESGSYYTPRPVVSFMCREALKGYLEPRESGALPQAIHAFVERHKTSGISSHAHGIREALAEIKVVDPACGSGAYLLGMMQELVDLRTSLDSEELRRNPRYLYDLKLHIIQRNLYGVDIDEFAVNIAMLRMWLSLAIEYEGEVPEPLPNLDFKVVCGDSLLGPDPMPAGQSDFTWYEVRRLDLGAVKDHYMRAVRQPDKTNLKQQIEDIKQHVRDALGDAGVPPDVVDWRVEFAEVFAERGGFDVVIANPPYVRMEKLNKDDEKKYKELFPEVAASRADILVYFYARAIELMRPGGWLAFITSNEFTKRRYGGKLRRRLAETLSISTVIDFGEIKIFDATVEVLILTASNLPPRPETVVKGHNLYPLLARRLGRGANVERAQAEMSRLSQDLETEVSIFSQARLDDSEWRIEDESINRLFERLMNQGTPLGRFVDGRIYRGVVTGLNQAFVIDRYKRDELVDADPPSAEIIKPWLRGRDIKRWKAEWAGLYVIFANRGVDIDRYPAIRTHLERYRPKLERRATSHLHPWYELQQPQEGIYEEVRPPEDNLARIRTFCAILLRHRWKLREQQVLRHAH